MNRSFFLYGDLEHDVVSTLIDDIETWLFHNPKNTDILIYINSAGGDIFCGEIIKNFIEEKSIDVNFTLIGSSEISSTAFNLFFEVDCEKTILRDTTACVHLTYNSFNTSELKDKYSEDYFSNKNIEAINKRDIQEYTDMGLTKEELNRIKSGKQVYLNYDRLLELLNYEV